MNINGKKLMGPEIKIKLKSGSIPKEDNNLKIFEIRNRVSKCISKMKKSNVEVFDECIAYRMDETKNVPDRFEICFKYFQDTDDKVRVIHLTGLVSEEMKRSA